MISKVEQDALLLEAQSFIDQEALRSADRRGRPIDPYALVRDLRKAFIELRSELNTLRTDLSNA